jgi:DNA-binding winged helix-turn-helix (wHTH) protein
LIKTIREKGYRFTGQATAVVAEEPVAEQQQSDLRPPPGDTILHIGNGVRIAYATVGSGRHSSKPAIG